MKIRNLVYLAQIEEYNSNRVLNWLKNNPKKEVVEIKKRLIITPKTALIFFLTKMFSLFLKPEQSIYLALNIIYPIDWLFKYFLVLIAKFKIRILHPKLITIGITGSWGKTTSKETLWKILSNNYPTEKTTENQNTLIGISLKILKLPIKTKIFVCEMGAYQAGDIKNICQLTKPKIGIITAIGPMHLERFGTMQKIIKTKLEIVDSLSNKGQAFIPTFLKNHVNYKNKNILYFNDISEIYTKIGKIFNINPTIINKIIKNPLSVEHRHEITDNGTVKIIDNTYNSNPASFKKPVDILFQQQTKVRIIITPGMVELGQLSFKENYEAALYASHKCTHAIIVGNTNKKALKKGLNKLAKNKLYFVKSINEADDILQQIIIPKNTTILIENDLPDNYF